MTLFTDNPFEKMMIQRPGGRRDNAPPVPHSPACASCPYKGQLPCVGYCLKQVQEKKASNAKVLCYFHFAVGAFYHEYSQNLYGVRLSQHSRFDKGNICIIVWVTLYWRMSAFPILLQLHSNLQQYTFANP